MLIEAELNHFLDETALQDLKIESLGSTYEMLCHAFPLQSIQTKLTHKTALKILVKLSEYLTNYKTKKTVKKQILNYMDTLGILAEEYEKASFTKQIEKISGRDVLVFLMEQHELKQNDLAKDFGSQSIVSELLSGKRKLNSHQISTLTKRFAVSPSVFFPI